MLFCFEAAAASCCFLADTDEPLEDGGGGAEPRPGKCDSSSTGTVSNLRQQDQELRKVLGMV